MLWIVAMVTVIIAIYATRLYRKNKDAKPKRYKPKLNIPILRFELLSDLRKPYDSPVTISITDKTGKEKSKS